MASLVVDKKIEQKRRRCVLRRRDAFCAIKGTGNKGCKKCFNPTSLKKQERCEDGSQK
jgi:hypothetical protein